MLGAGLTVPLSISRSPTFPFMVAFAVLVPLAFCFGLRFRFMLPASLPFPVEQAETEVPGGKETRAERNEDKNGNMLVALLPEADVTRLVSGFNLGSMVDTGIV